MFYVGMRKFYAKKPVWIGLNWYSWSQKVTGHVLGGLFDSKHTACFTNIFPSFDSTDESVFGRSVTLSARSLILLHVVDKNEDGVGI